MKSNDQLGNVFQIVNLLKKHAGGDALIGSERAELEKWLAASERNRRLFARITDESQLALALVELRDTDTEGALKRVRTRIDANTRSHTFRWRWVAAAAILVFFAIGWLVVEDRWSMSGDQKSVGSRQMVDVKPGGSRATLTLADGRIINLSETQAGIVSGDGITYLDGSRVMTNEALKMKNGMLNSISTPKGGTYQITLSDSTKVWLNAASTLKYPSKFTRGERIVELEGEAYFEVSDRWAIVGGRERVPFLVKTSGQTIRVLGTAFNVSAYVDQSETKTTLVTGSVQVVPSNDRQPSITIRPGQQSVFQGNEIEVYDVDTRPYVAWKNGYFHFDGTPFAEVMAQMCRWYDIELVYQGGAVPSQTFTGKMSRSVSLSNVFKLFKGSGIKFRLEGRKLFIEGS